MLYKSLTVIACWTNRARESHKMAVKRNRNVLPKLVCVVIRKTLRGRQHKKVEDGNALEKTAKGKMKVF